MTAKADPGEGRSTHDLILTSGATTVPLILCDRNGIAQPACVHAHTHQQEQPEDVHGGRRSTLTLSRRGHPWHRPIGAVGAGARTSTETRACTTMGSTSTL